MTLIERLEKYFGNLYDADIEVYDGGRRVTPNREGRIWQDLKFMIELNQPLDVDILMGCEEYFEKSLTITEVEEELMQEINKAICEILTTKEL